MKPPSHFSSVSLTKAEILEAAVSGLLRRYKALTNGTRRRYGYESDDAWGSDIEAAAAERLVAKATGTYWIGAVLRPDAGVDAGPYGVRHTLRTNGGLILHEADRDDEWFCLVVGAIPNQRIAGVMLASEGKHSRYWREDVRTPCFIVPQEELHAA